MRFAIIIRCLFEGKHLLCCFRDDEEDDNPVKKVVREKVRRQANNARERSVVWFAADVQYMTMFTLLYNNI